MPIFLFAFPKPERAGFPTARELAELLVEIRRAEMLHLDSHVQRSEAMHHVAQHAITAGMSMVPRRLGRQRVFDERVAPQAARQLARVMDERERAER